MRLAGYPGSAALQFRARIQAAPQSLRAKPEGEDGEKQVPTQGHRLAAGLLGREIGLGQARVSAPIKGV